MIAGRDARWGRHANCWMEGERMRNLGLAKFIHGFICCGFVWSGFFWGLPSIAAEKPRDWQTGQVVESKVDAGPQVHTIAAAGKNYVVKGSMGSGSEEDTLTAGASVRFAVEGKTMFLSIAGKEYRLNVLGETRAAARPAAAAVEAPHPVVTPVEAPRPVATPVTPIAPRSSATPVTQIDAPRPAAPVQAPRPSVPPNPPAAAAGGAPGEALVQPLDNDAVVKMILAGLKEDTVIRVIQTRPGKYVLTPDALAGLKAAGVPQSVVSAMTAAMSRR